jgi:putative transposase
VKFDYKSDAGIHSLLETFRLMCNDAMRAALSKKPKNKFQLIGFSNKRLREYGLHSHYILSACEVAYSAYKNKKRRSNPYFRKPFLKLDNQTYKLNYLLLRIPIGPRRYYYLTQSGSAFHRSFLANKDLKLGSVIVTESNVALAFSKETLAIERKGTMGIDVNERNVTWSDSLGESKAEDTSVICQVKELYNEIKARITRRTYKDRRIMLQLLGKYGKKQRNRTSQKIRQISKKIVRHAKENGLGIAMENLKGIRKKYRKGNGQGRFFRTRMNSWSFYEFQRQIEYKALWEGIPVTYVNPRGTSRNCPNCGSHVVPLQERKLFCALCDKIWDRDVLASLNIMAASLVRAERSPECSNEGEPQQQETVSNPLSRRVEGVSPVRIQANTPEP